MKLKTAYCKLNNLWCMVDATTGFTIFLHERPSVIRKAKLWWFCYLNAETEELANRYIEKMVELND